MIDPDPYETMSAEEVLELAAIVESRAPQMYDAMDSVLATSEIPQDVLETTMQTPRDHYCDDCGHVGGHAPDCPAARRASLLEEEPEAPPRRRAPEIEPVGPLVRRIGRSLLLRVLHALDD